MKNSFSLLIFLFFAQFVIGQNSNVSNGVIFDGEPFIALNPYDENHLVIAWMGWSNFTELIVIKTRASFDGGDTWSPIVKIGHDSLDYTSADPSLAFDANGDVYLAYIDHTKDLILPETGGIYIKKSTDGGLSWGNTVEVVNLDVAPGQRVIDRPWMVIDRSPSASQGNIYVTSMNAKNAMPEYHPYISISTDNGASFTWKDLDGPNWLSGSLFTSPMPTPSVNSDGLLGALYPSYVSSQNVLPQMVFAKSNDGGNTFSYHTVYTSTGPTTTGEEAKKGYLLRADPSNPQHWIYLYLSNEFEYMDVVLRETFDEGLSWSNPKRVNDDPISNDRMQDLVWADFDDDGDLVVSWRDRRNGSDSTYLTSSEIWAAFRDKDSTDFSTNFQITDQLVGFDSVLLESGNDFMGIALQNDVIHATWGDPRSGRLNVWYQKMSIDGVISSTQDLSTTLEFSFYPNPSSTQIEIQGENMSKVELINTLGQTISSVQTEQKENLQIDISELSPGTYYLHVQDNKGNSNMKAFLKP